MCACCRMALNVQLYLKMDRVDFAEKQLKAMLALDEDASRSASWPMPGSTLHRVGLAALALPCPCLPDGGPNSTTACSPSTLPVTAEPSMASALGGTRWSHRCGVYPMLCGLMQGGSKVQEALLIFQELCEKFSWTVPVMNGSAVCQMFMGRYDEAESLLPGGP